MLFITHVPQNTSVKQIAVQLQWAVISHPKFLQINIELQKCTCDM